MSVPESSLPALLFTECKSINLSCNPSFEPSQIDGTFSGRRRKGLYCIGDLYIEGQFASFSQLKSKFTLLQSHFFCYLQIRNYVKKNIPQFITKPENHIIHDLLSSHPETRHLVSCFVSAFATSVCTKHLKAVWSTELNDEIWEEALLRIKSCSVNSRYKLIQFKVIHRLHYSKTRLNKIFPSISSQCDRCNRAEVTLAHLFGFCPVLYVFWSKIFELFSSAYKINIQPDHSLAIFWLF